MLESVAGWAGGHDVDVHIMTFSFTDELIAQLLAELARSSSVTVRIIADWSQGSTLRAAQVRRLADLRLANVAVRYKNDQPYEWDAAGERLRWSYHASRGLLHHKTMGIFVDGSPKALVCGSFNWTGKASRSYENLLVLTDDDEASRRVMQSVEHEFEAMWSDGLVTLSPDEAREHHRRIVDEYRRHPTTPSAAIVGLGRGQDTPLRLLPPPEHNSRVLGTAAASGGGGDATMAFSSRSPHQSRGEAGYSPLNRARRFELRKPSGRTKRVPLTLTTLALDVIARATEGDSLKVAMYGLSPRVPEYGAMLDAARRGVRVQVLLDGHVGRAVLLQLAERLVREDLPMQLRGGCRMMHQKYLIHPQSDTVLTGTANMSTDASSRHSENRMLIRGCPGVMDRFLADFRTIWSRVPSPFRVDRGAVVPPVPARRGLDVLRT